MFAEEHLFTHRFHLSFIDIREVRLAHREDSQSVQEKQKRVSEEGDLQFRAYFEPRVMHV